MTNDKRSQKMIKITIEMSEIHAQAYAQFLKRVCFTDYQKRAVSEEDTNDMVCAGEIIRAALREAGFAPR
jgi:hypothetical protein